MLFMAITEHTQSITSIGSGCIHHCISCPLLSLLKHYLWGWYTFCTFLSLHLLIFIISYRYMTQGSLLFPKIIQNFFVRYKYGR